jgi:DHA1 family multidrug resistance protein-like MFS transporter
MGASWKKTLYSTCIAQFIAMVGFGFVLPFMAFYIHDLGVPEGPQADKWAGILVTAMGIPMAICSPIWGWIADRHGRKGMVLRAMFGGAITVALMAFVQNVHQLLVLRILQGILTGTIMASIALVAAAVPLERSGYALGLVTVSASGGNFMGPLLGGYAAKFVGYRATFIVAGAILFVGGFIVAYGTEEKFERHAASRTGVTRAFLPLLAIGSFLVPLLTLCLISFAASAPAPIFPYFVKSISALDDKSAAALTGIIISVVGLVETLSAWIFGSFGDRWGHRQVMMAAVVWGGIMAGLQAYARNIPELMTFRILFAFGMAGIFPTASAIIRKVVPEHSLGKAFGLVASLNSLGWAFGPLAGAYFSAYMRDYRPTFTLSGVALCVVSLFIAWRVREPSAAAESVQASAPSAEP